MTSSKRARRRRRTAGRKRHAPSDPPAYPRPLRLIAQSFEELGAYVTATDNPRQAADLALEHLHSAVDTIVQAMAGQDSLDVAEAIAVTNLLNDPETFTEAEHEGNLGALELVELIACSGTVIACAAPPDQYDITAQPDIDQVQAAAIDALDAGMMWQLFSTAADSHSASGLAFHLALDEANLRNTSYPHMVRATLQALLADPETDRDLQAVAGFSAQQLLDVADHLITLRNAGWTARIAELRRLDSADVAQSDATDEEFAVRAKAAFSAAFANPARVAVLDPDSIAATTGVSSVQVGRILVFLTCDVSDSRAHVLAEQYFRGNNPLRGRPILRHPTGRQYLANDALILPAIRERVEDAFKAARDGSFDRYSRRRGHTVEAAALQLLQTIFPTATTRDSFQYFVPEEPAENTPDRYTKRVEGDGLLLIDDVAIVVEVKAGALSDAARNGNVARLRRDLSGLLSDAADQAARTRERIVQDRGLRLDDGSWLDLDFVREIHTIVVTLEDLSGLSTLTDELVSAGLLPATLLPLTISLHDMRIIAELVERPAEFLLYLRRRTLPELTRHYLAPDELDLYLHMLRRGLYVEPDPEQLALEVPHFTATTAQRRRFRAQRPQWLTTETGPLDQWYAHQLGQRATPAAKPRFNGNDRLLTLIDELTRAAEPGWLPTTTTLLSGSGPVQRMWIQYADDLVARTRRDRSPHTMTLILGDRAQNATVLAWLSIPAGLTPASYSEFQRQYRLYLAAKTHQMGFPRGSLIMLDTDGRYCQLLYTNRRPGPDPDLDAEVIALGLAAPEKMTGGHARATAARRAGQRRRR